MKVVEELPPNFNDIASVLPAAKKFGVLFTYGSVIYNPSKVFIPLQLMDHEEVHMVQQGDNPDIWWQRYLVDEDFRFEQELEAHRMEYRSYGLNHNRAMRQEYLHNMAIRLAGPLYGSQCRPSVAKKLIKEKGPSMKEEPIA